jgi:hypothetical protein
MTRIFITNVRCRWFPDRNNRIDQGTLIGRVSLATMDLGNASGGPACSTVCLKSLDEKLFGFPGSGWRHRRSGCELRTDLVRSERFGRVDGDREVTLPMEGLARVDSAVLGWSVAPFSV